MSVEHHVIGPPGTGKTHYLSRQAPLAAQKVGAEGVMITSLTNAAANEIGARVQGLPKENVGTLHSIGLRSQKRSDVKIADSRGGLRRWNEIHPGLAIDPETHGRSIDALPEDRGGAAASGPGGPLLEALGLYRHRMTPEPLWERSVVEFEARWTAWKREEGLIDFTDMVALATDEPPEGVRILMVDEAQDLSALEVDLLRRWSAGLDQLVIVGDPDQALFTWRGATPEQVFREGAASFTVLEQSHRVPVAVHQFASRWIEQVPGRAPVAYKPTDVEGTLGHLSMGDWRRPGIIARAVQKDLDEGMGVMVIGSCAYMLAPLIKTLRERGIPWSNPYRPEQNAWNPLGDKGAAPRLRAFLKEHWTWGDVAKWAEHLRARDVLQPGAKNFLRGKAEVKTNRFDDDPADAPAEIDTVLGLFVDPAWVIARDAEAWSKGHVGSQEPQTRFAASLTREQLHDPPLLCVGTIHSVKGGEADSVYVLPDLSSAGWAGARGRPSRDPNTLRQFYVAFTRARQKLTLCAGAQGGKAVSWHVPT